MRMGKAHRECLYELACMPDGRVQVGIVLVLWMYGIPNDE